MSAMPDDLLFGSIDGDTAAKLEIVADPGHPVGRDAATAFLAACEADAKAHGYVSVNRVSAALEDEGIEHHRYSAFWSRFTGKGRPMRRARADESPQGFPFEARKGSKTGNDGRLMPLRMWQG